MTPAQTGPESGRHLPNAHRRAQERRVWSRALLVSVVLHVLVFLLLANSEHEPLNDQGASGAEQRDEEPLDGGLQAVAIGEAPERVTVPDGVPVPVPELREPPELEPEPRVETAEFADGFEGLRDRPGDELGEAEAGAEGDGAGDGGSGEGGLQRTVPPSPRGLIVPPSNPELDGADVRVRVFVTEQGEVVPDSTLLIPPTDDEGFNARLKEEAASWRFEPATREGDPVAEWFTYEVSM